MQNATGFTNTVVGSSKKKIYLNARYEKTKTTSVTWVFLLQK